MLITPSFFVDDISIPNNMSPMVFERINGFINKFEPRLLRDLLGNELYELLLSEKSERMESLINGTNFIGYEGYNDYWEGLVHDKEQSLIAYYVYYQFEESNATQSVGLGTTIPNNNAQKAVTPADKMIGAWNNMSNSIKDLTRFLWYSKDGLGGPLFPEFTEWRWRLLAHKYRAINYFGI